MAFDCLYGLLHPIVHAFARHGRGCGAVCGVRFLRPRLCALRSGCVRLAFALTAAAAAGRGVSRPGDLNGPFDWIAVCQLIGSLL